MSFSQRFCKNAHEYLTKPTLKQEEDLEYAQLFHEGLLMVKKAYYFNEHTRDLDYSQINEEELLWLAGEINELPNPEDSILDYRDNNLKRVLLRDQVARSVFEFTLKMEGILLLRCRREEEIFF